MVAVTALPTGLQRLPGGRWRLATVGQWAVDLAARAPVAAGIALGLVAAVKLLGAAVPVAVAHGFLPWPRSWRAISWVGGLLLVVYGGVNTVVALAVLAGVIRPEGGYDTAAMRGHAYLWDPLFFLRGRPPVVEWSCRGTTSPNRRPSCPTLTRP